MSFFNKLGETLSNTSKDLASKAKEMAEISSLNGQIGTQEEMIKSLYIEIGKDYFQTHQDDMNLEDPYYERLEKIRAGFEKIEELKKNIQVIKGATTCAACGAQLDKDAAFCTACGAKVEKEVEEAAADLEIQDAPETITCIKCGMTLDADTKFCKGCGWKVEVPEFAEENEVLHGEN